MMMGSWMGSDFTNYDLVKESSLIKDYKTTNVKESDGNIEITLVPHKNTVSLWGKILLVVEKKSELPLKQEYFDERNEKIRILFYRDVKKIWKQDNTRNNGVATFNKKRPQNYYTIQRS